MFGTELLAAPITEPMDKSSRRGKADVWLPQGDWFDFFTGRRYSASSPNGRRMTVWRPLDGIPVFAKAGGIVPMQPLSEGIPSTPSTTRSIWRSSSSPERTATSR